MTIHRMDFGTSNAGGAPVFTTYRRGDTDVALTPPAITEIGDGWYKFTIDWAATTAPSIFFKATLNGAEISDEIPNPGVAGSAAVPAGVEDIVNLALDHLAVTKKIVTINDTSEEAKAGKRWVNFVRRELIRHFVWEFSEKRSVLVQNTDVANKHPHWAYVYDLPSDHFVPTEIIVEAYRNVPADWRIPLQVRRTAAGTGDKLYTDYPPRVGYEPLLSYSIDPTNVSDYPDHFTSLYSYALAVKMAMPLRVDRKLVKEFVWPAYQMAMSVALASEKGYRVPDPQPDASWILARY